MTEVCGQPLGRGDWYSCVLHKDHEGWCRCSPYCSGHVGSSANGKETRRTDGIESERIKTVREFSS